jgi:hypothetical protein
MRTLHCHKNTNLISVLVDGIEQSAFPVKGSAEYQSTSCTNGETAVWDAVNWKLSVQDISASTRCVVSFITGGHNVYVTVSGGTVDSAPKQVVHNGNVTFVVAAANSNYVFTSVTCSGAGSYSWANNVLSVNGVTADAYCSVVFSRPVYTVYFNVVGGYTSDNYLTVVRGGSNSTTFGAIAGFLTSGATITCDAGITGTIAGTRIVVSNVLSSGDCTVQCSQDTSNFLPGGATYNIGDQVSYANLPWLVVGSDSESVTLILQGNAVYSSTSGSNVTGTGIYGSGVVFTSSSARSYLQDIWLQQTAQSYLKSAIDSGGIIYQDDANGYVRLPYASEINTNLPNANNTNFWTMDNDGNGHIYYGQPSGYLTEGKNTSDSKYYFEHYTLASTTAVSYSGLTSCSGSGSGTTTQYYSTTCGVQSGWIGHCNCSGHVACGATGAQSVSRIQGACIDTNGTAYYSGITFAGGYYAYNSSSCLHTDYVSGVCALTTGSSWSNVTIPGSVTFNPVSGTSYVAGSYSNGYKKWVKNAGTETKYSTATLNTTLSYSNTTTGNSGMSTSVQAVLPTSASARDNDSVPSNSNIATFPVSNISITSGTLALPGTYYQGYSLTSCAAIAVSSVTSFSAGSITNPTCTQYYRRYTLQDYNTSTMGYRPVIVVKKAN